MEFSASQFEADDETLELELANNVKLVVWDLDDTFWEGTLAEGAIVPIPANHEIVATLCRRGIMSGICSKNDFEQTKAKLIELGVWDHFIFPRIQFTPKGQLVGEIIDDANLRAENVLFIDDNHLNREEVRHYCPGIMVADPVEILGSLLSLPQLQGKDDSDLTRLKQYKSLEQKSVHRRESKLENEAFLRECGIRVDIKYDVEAEFDRIVELANRTNQLNFTKIRLENPKAIENFRKTCGAYGTTVGTVHVSDRYGDYGIVGYFLLRVKGAIKELQHFVFSCRTMNMGIEQYVYERLGEPDINVMAPVANPIKTFAKVDWIEFGTGGEVTLGALEGSKKLVLIGGCELRQLASLCSTNRAEYVNEVEYEHMIRHDDLGFILSDRERLEQDEPFSKTFTWKAASAKQFDLDVRSSSIVIASLFRAVQADYFRTAKGTWFGLGQQTLQGHLTELTPVFFVKNFWFKPLGMQKKLAFVSKCLDRLAVLAPANARLFALGVSTWIEPNAKNVPGENNLRAREAFNAFVKSYCATSSKFVFVDLDQVVQAGDMITSTHFHRRGYLSIAQFISQSIASSPKSHSEVPLAADTFELEPALADESFDDFEIETPKAKSISLPAVAGRAQQRGGDPHQSPSLGIRMVRVWRRIIQLLFAK